MKTNHFEDNLKRLLKKSRPADYRPEFREALFGRMARELTYNSAYRDFKVHVGPPLAARRLFPGGSRTASASRGPTWETANNRRFWRPNSMIRKFNVYGRNVARSATSTLKTFRWAGRSAHGSCRRPNSRGVRGRQWNILEILFRPARMRLILEAAALPAVLVFVVISYLTDPSANLQVAARQVVISQTADNRNYLMGYGQNAVNFVPHASSFVGNRPTRTDAKSADLPQNLLQLAATNNG